MADVSVESAISTSTARGGRCLVFPTPDIGYVFYVYTGGLLVYRKTTDGGATWGSRVTVDGVAEATIAYDVWFDQWTPGDAGTLIHVWWFGATNDDIFYRTLNITGDVLGTQRTANNLASAVAGRGAFVSGTKTRSGYLYCCYDIDAGAEKGIVRSTDGGTNWSTNLLPGFIEATLDTAKLFPATGTGDNNDCWAIYYDASATALTIKMWDSSAGGEVESATFQTHTDGATDLTGQFGYDGTIRHADGHLLVAAVSLRDNAASVHQVFDVTSTSTITTKTNITTNIDDHYFPQIFVNQGTGTIFVAYNGKRDGSEVLDTTTKVYYTYSTDGGTTWNAGDAAYMEGAAGIVVQTWTPNTGQRFYAIWRVGTTLVGNKVNSLIQLVAQVPVIAATAVLYGPTLVYPQTITGATIPSGTTGAPLVETTVTIGEKTGTTFAGCHDTIVKQSSPTQNYTVHEAFEPAKYDVGDHTHGLMKFPGLSNIPSAGTVTAATLYLQVRETPGTTTITARRLLRNWVVNQATWNLYSTGNAWGTVGGVSAGVDRASAVSASTAIGVADVDTWKAFTSAQLIADVQGFVSGSMPNYGWHFERTDGQDDEVWLMFFSSDESAGLALRPYLDVTYTTGVATGLYAPEVALGGAGGGDQGVSGATIASTLQTFAPLIGVLTFRSDANVGESAGGYTSVTCPKPAGTVAGDLLIAWPFHAASGSGGTASALVPPAGWSSAYEVLAPIINGAYSIRSRIDYKIAGASEPADYTWTWSGGAQSRVCTISCWSNPDPTTPFTPGSAVGAGFVDTAGVTIASLTVALANQLNFVFGICDESANWTHPAGMTLHRHTAGSGYFYASQIVQPTATGTRTATTSNSLTDGHAVSLLFNSVALAGGGPATVSGVTIASAGARYAATVTVGAVTVTGATVAATNQRFIPTIVPGPVTPTGATIASGNQRFVPTIVPGPVTVTGATIGVGSVVQAPAVPASGSQAVTGGTVPAGSVVRVPAVVPGAVTVAGAFRAPANQRFAPTVAPGVMTITAGTRASTAACFALVVVRDAAVGTGHVASTSVLFALVVARDSVGVAHIGPGSRTFAPELATPVTTGTIGPEAVARPPRVALEQAGVVPTIESGVVCYAPALPALVGHAHVTTATALFVVRVALESLSQAVTTDFITRATIDELLQEDGFKLVIEDGTGTYILNTVVDDIRGAPSVSGFVLLAEAGELTLSGGTLEGIAFRRLFAEPVALSLTGAVARLVGPQDDPIYFDRWLHPGGGIDETIKPSDVTTRTEPDAVGAGDDVSTRLSAVEVGNAPSDLVRRWNP